MDNSVYATSTARQPEKAPDKLPQHYTPAIDLVNMALRTSPSPSRGLEKISSWPRNGYSSDASGPSSATSVEPRTVGNRVSKDYIKAMAAVDVDCDLFSHLVTQVVDSCIPLNFVEQITDEVNQHLHYLHSSPRTVQAVGTKLKEVLGDRLKTLSGACIAQPMSDYDSALLDVNKKTRLNPNRTLYIQDLPSNVTEGILRKEFLSYSSEVHCLIPRNQDTGFSRGYGFVELDSVESAEIALVAKKNFSILGRQVKTFWHSHAMYARGQRRPMHHWQMHQWGPRMRSTRFENTDTQMIDWDSHEKGFEDFGEAEAEVDEELFVQAGAPEATPPASSSMHNGSDFFLPIKSSTPIVDLLHGPDVPTGFPGRGRSMQVIHRIADSIIARCPKDGYQVKLVDTSGELTNLGTKETGFITLMSIAVTRAENLKAEGGSKKPMDAAHAIEEALRPFVGVNREHFPELTECEFMQDFVGGIASCCAINDEDYDAIRNIKRKAEAGRKLSDTSLRKQDYSTDDNLPAELVAKLQDLFIFR